MESRELQIMPFEARELTGEQILVIAPHPDDEVIGCGGVLALAARAGRSITVMIVSDGAASVSGDDPSSTRERESLAGLEKIGVTTKPEFLGLPDRHVAEHSVELNQRLVNTLERTRPDLILVPSPLDIHPDHVSVTKALWSLVQKDPAIANRLARATVAFYETSQPLAPDLLVDITDVAEAKFEAIRAHESQRKERDYEWFARGLAQYRALTLPGETRYAEAYKLISIAEFAIRPWSELVEQTRPGGFIDVIEEPMPVTVLVRTKDRLDLLSEAIESIERCRRSSSDVSVVLINDGGESPSALVEGRDWVKLIDRDESGGRANALNEAAAASTTPFLCFLDDDDLFFPEHVQVLRSHWREGLAAVYSDAITSFWTQSNQQWSHRDSLRIFSQDWRPDLLVFENYIPLNTLMIRRETWSELGGVDAGLDLFEDWDFLIRLSRTGSAIHIPQITCEVRVFEGGDAITQTQGEGSEAFRDAKLSIWKRHEDLATWSALVDWQAHMKRLAFNARSEAAESAGRAHLLETEQRRAHRENAELVRNAGKEHERASAAANQMGARINTLQEELAKTSVNYERMATRIGELQSELNARETTLANRETLLETHFAEIAHLSGILDQIYASRTWKLHTLVERIKGVR